MKANKPIKQTQEGYLQPNQEVFKIEGKVSYHEGLRAHGKILLKKDILTIYPELKNRNKCINYLMAHPTSLKECKEYLEEFYKKAKTLPMLLFFKQSELVHQDKIIS